jgi:S-adenosylmethionine hydrolase
VQHLKPLVLLTDFGVKDGAVAAMKGVAHGVSAALNVVDLTHEIPPFNLLEGAYRLRQAAAYWEPGTVFVIVVDPGVGTNRKSLAARDNDGRLYVCPDNGLLTFIAEDIGLSEVRELDETTQRLPGSNESYTFLGRDLYAFVGAKLAGGTMRLEDAGETIQGIQRLEIPAPTLEMGRVTGVIPVLDIQFGNVWSNIPKRLLDEAGFHIGDTLEVSVFHDGAARFRDTVQFVPSFGHVPQGQHLLYVNSLLHASLGINAASFAQEYGISSGTGWTVELRKFGS